VGGFAARTHSQFHLTGSDQIDIWSRYDNAAATEDIGDDRVE
jgi:hypothetical protein